MSALVARLVAGVIATVLFGTPIVASVCAGWCVGPALGVNAAAAADHHCASASQANGEIDSSAQMAPMHGACCANVADFAAAIVVAHQVAGGHLLAPAPASSAVPGSVATWHQHRSPSPPPRTHDPSAAPLPLRI